VVDEKQWVSERRFLHALGYCMLLPGPEAQQLATYLGWLLHGVRGGLVAGSLFILPGFLAILLLSVLYAGFHEVGLVAGVFFGLKPAVLAVVIEAVLRLRRRALAEAGDTAIAAGAFVAIFMLGVPFPAIVAGAALAGALLRSPRHGADDGDVQSVPRPSFRVAGRTALAWLAIWLAPVTALVVVLGTGHVFVSEAVFFSKAAVVTFGGAYAVLAYVAQRAVEAYQWLRPAEMLDGLGMAETTPGPLIQVVQFVGFIGAYRYPGTLHPMVAGIIGSVVTTWVTFAPCFLFILVGAPFIEYLRGNRALNAALKGITAAVVGVVLNLAVWFALHTLFAEVHAVGIGVGHILVPRAATFDWRALIIAVGATVAMLRFKVGMMWTLGAAAIAGVLVHAVG